MGSCCTTNYEKNLEVKNNFEHIETETNNIIANLTKSELKFEQINYEISDEDIELGKIINKLKYLYKEKIKVFTEIELINLAIYSKENSDNDYLIFDMRLSLEQKENYLKKIKHINYTFDQIRNIKKINKYELLQNFIDNKDIIIITAKKYLSPQYKKDKNENEDYTIEICNLLYIINSNNIQFKLLNSCLDKPEKKKDKFVNYLSLYYNYDFLPYILFTYKHVTTFYKEGYFFINFTNELLFNINKYIKVLNEINNEEHQEKYSDRLNEENVKYKFLNDMSVTTIINIDNELKTSFDIKEKDYKRNSFKEIFLNKNDLNIEMNKISELILWMKKEILRGHSCYFNIVNYDVNFLENDAQDNNWIFIIIFILLMVTEVEYFEVINYLKEKMIYFDEIEQVLNESINKEEIIELITKYKSF